MNSSFAGSGVISALAVNRQQAEIKNINANTAKTISDTNVINKIKQMLRDAGVRDSDIDAMADALMGGSGTASKNKNIITAFFTGLLLL